MNEGRKQKRKKGVNKGRKHGMEGKGERARERKTK